MLKWKWNVLVVGVVACLAAAASPTAGQQPCLEKAWAALNAADYARAIKAADDCINDFGARAARDQARFEATREPIPPTGAVDNTSDRQRVFARWAVNDVSTAYFVKGRAAEHLLERTRMASHRSMALAAYNAAMKLTYGRCWDPKGWFWSPAEASQDRLSALKAGTDARARSMGPTRAQRMPQ